MRKLTAALALGLVLIAGALAAPSFHAESGQEPSGSMRDHGMTGTKDGNGDGGMMGMMRAMRQMGRMTGHCGGMMSDGRPNEQWRRSSPSPSDRKE